MANNRLKQLRTSRNLYQKDIAEVIGKTVQAYSYYETGKREMDNETLNRLSSFYQVSIDYLLGYSSSPIDNEHGLDTTYIDKAFALLEQMDSEQQKTAIRLLKALAEENKE